MKTLTMATAVVAALAMSLSLGACKSNEPGVKTSKVQQWTTVSADTRATTAAAEEVLKAEKLTDVRSNSTALDGEATGKLADGTLVKVSIAKQGSGSEVTVRVGTFGDSPLGAELARKIKDRVEDR